MEPNLETDGSIGERIRSLRLRRGRSIRQLSALAGISHAQWSRIESGKRSADNRFMLAAIAAALSVPMTDLTAVTGSDGRGGIRHAANNAMYRMMQAVVEADLDDPATDAPTPIAPMLDQVELLLDLRLKCDYTGAARLIPPLLTGLHRAAFGPDRDQALRALVIAEDTASFVIRYLGDPAAAVLIADRGRQAANHLQDPVMIALAGWSQAHAAAGCGLHQRTLRISERAATDLEPHLDLPDAPEMLGQLYVLNAFARYTQGDISGADAAVAEAMKLARTTGQSDALGLYFGPTNVAFWQISMQADSGDPADAVRTAQHVDPAGFSAIGRSRRIAFYIDTARALTNVNKDREALRMLLAAEREAPQRIRLSPIVADSMRSMLERSRRGTGWSELRGLCERMNIPL